MILRVAIEFLVAALVALSPWALGGYPSFARFSLSLIIAALAVLGAVRMALVRRWNRSCSWPLCCLGALAILAIVQSVRLPAAVTSVVSPGSADVYSYFLPSEPELLPGEPAANSPEAHPLSVAPGETRKSLIDLLALMIVFAVVANNCVSASSFRRLAVVCVVTGTLASLLGLVQRVSPPKNDKLVLWFFEASGNPFGPFGNRNHFPSFTNFCIGLALGLLVAVAQKKRSFFEGGRTVWLLAAIGCMVAGVMASLSRGGFAAMVAALALGGAIAFRSGPVRSSAGRALWFVPAVIVVCIWYGGTVWDKRLATNETETETTTGRIEAWASGLTVFPQFPLLGTGGGTFGWVERMNHPTGGGNAALFGNAHNEYVEALVEGGLCRLLLTVAFVYVVSRAGLQNYRRHRGRSLAWLILGGLIGFWALTIQSFVDFGVHIPAVALLAVVVTAQVVCARQDDSPDQWARLPRLLCMGAGMALVGVSLLVCREYYMKRLSDRHVAAADAINSGSSADKNVRIVEQLRAASQCQPQDAFLYTLLARDFAGPAILADDPETAASSARQSLRYARLARNASPLSAEPHVLLARNRDAFARAPSAVWYLERACRAEPRNPLPWYTMGWERLRTGDAEGACRDWRKSLEISGAFLAPIVESARINLSEDVLLEKILPNNPQIIKEAADRLESPSGGGPGPNRLTYLQKALRLLDARGNDRAAKDERVRGVILVELGREDEGLASLRKAVEKDGAQIGARMELAKELYRRDYFEEAKRQAVTLLSMEPHNMEARELLEEIERSVKISSD